MESRNNLKKILIMIDWYEPGYKAGGPIRSCVNFAEQMKDDYQLFVFTGDRDWGDHQPYKNVTTGQWLDKNGIRVFYAKPGQLSFSGIQKMICDTQPDFIYLNNLYSKKFTLYPLLLKKMRRISARVILAPRGMLKSSALAMKATKKKIFLSIFKALGIHRLVSWQATDKQEAEDILKRFPGVELHLAPNFPPLRGGLPATLNKDKGRLRMVYVGRIHPIKNLRFLLDLLPPIEGDLELDIIGMIEDENYWMNCRKQITDLGKKFQINFLGELEPESLMPVLHRSHIFALPTRGENFGHAIYEALAAGKPVLISDQSPWRNLEPARAGWDISLDNRKGFERAIQTAVQWDQSNYDQWSLGAWSFAQQSVDTKTLKSKYVKIFS